MNNQQLTPETLRRVAPSVFTAEPWRTKDADADGQVRGVSNQYRFISTAAILSKMTDAGFYPVRAQQSRTRIEGKRDYVKHMIRLRLSGQDAPQLGEVIPEIVLTNSHDGSAAYRIMFGLYRLICMNGAVVASAQFGAFSVRHIGDGNLPETVTRKSLSIFNQAPAILETVARWQNKQLDYNKQLEFSNAALLLNGSGLAIRPQALLYARRVADLTAETNRYNVQADTGSRNLWKTFNVIQENIIKGGVYGITQRNRSQHTRAIKSVDRDIRVNSDLWQLAETFYNNN